MGMPLLELRHVSKAYPDGWKLDDVSFTVRRHEIVCLLGPSGCGKSTLLRLIAGLERVDSGEVLVNGADVSTLPPHQRGFGLMFQEYALFPHKNVFGNVAFGLRMHGYQGEELKARVAEVLGLVGLSAFEERDVNQLSGGERQRVALARSLAPQPALLMLDEPLGALDRAMRDRLMDELPRILRRANMTTITVTHDQEEAFAIADRLILLRNGCVVQVGSPEEIYRQPVSVWVARFLGLHNVVDVHKVGDGWVDTPMGRLTVTASRSGQLASPCEVKVVIRPEAARVQRRDEVVSPRDGAEGNAIQVSVTDRSFRGESYRVEVKHESGLELTFMFPSSASLPAIGESIVLSLAREAVMLVESDDAVCSK